MIQQKNIDSLPLFPRPRSLVKKHGDCVIGAGLSARLASYLIGDDLPEGIRRTEHRRGSAPPNEDYRITVDPEGISISASNDKSLFYAVQTLRQLVSGLRNPALPCGIIFDYPAFGNRGVMWDISRDRVPTLETMSLLIDIFSLLKLNKLQLYTEHTFAYAGHEEVWKDASPYAAEDIESIIRYASLRGMEVVPNQNSFGHMERWMRHDKYRPLAETPEGFTDPWGFLRPIPSTLCPIDPASEALMRDLYGQLLPLFPAGQVNIGGDEPWELGQGRSKQACESSGKGSVYLDFILKLRNAAAEYGKTVQLWADIVINHPEIIPRIPEDMTLIEWGYEADHPFAEHCGLLREAGLAFYVCPGTSSWNSIGGRWDNARSNLEDAALQGTRFGADGYLIADWGDNGHLQQLPVSLPAIVYGADLAWNGGPDTGSAEPPEEAVGKWLSSFFFGESEGTWAKALFAAASLPRITGHRLHNAGILGILPIDHTYPYYRDQYEIFRNINFDAETGILKDALKGMRDGGTGANLFRREIEHTLGMLLHAADLGALLFKTRSFLITEIPEKERKRLSLKLGALMDEYGSLWMKRSRPGGFCDSAARLAGLRAMYDKV